MGMAASRITSFVPSRNGSAKGRVESGDCDGFWPISGIRDLM